MVANQAAVSHDNPGDNGLSYQQLLQQREEENRQEVERLTAEIRALKLQLLQLTNGKYPQTVAAENRSTKFCCLPQRMQHLKFHVRDLPWSYVRESII